MTETSADIPCYSHLPVHWRYCMCRRLKAQPPAEQSGYAVSLLYSDLSTKDQ